MTTAPRVLHVTECYAGGVSKAVDTLVELADEAEHHLVWSGDEVPHRSAGYRSIQRMPTAPWAAVAAIRRAVDRIQPDLIHAHSSWAGVYTRVVDLKTPVIYEPHCYKFDDAAQPSAIRFAYRTAEKLLLARTARTVVLSPHEESLARSLGRDVATHFLPNVASVRPTCLQPPTGFETNRSVAMIGRLSPQKDPRFFAEMARHAHEADSETRFIWIGDGDRRMRQLLADAGVEVTGWLDETEMIDMLAQPWVYFHTARYEGFPLSILDAAAFEHPIAARRIPAFDGTGIPSASTPLQAAELVSEIFRSSDAHAMASSAARNLNKKMSLESQRQSLSDLYHSNIEGLQLNERV